MRYLAFIGGILCIYLNCIASSLEIAHLCRLHFPAPAPDEAPLIAELVSTFSEELLHDRLAIHNPDSWSFACDNLAGQLRLLRRHNSTIRADLSGCMTSGFGNGQSSFGAPPFLFVLPPSKPSTCLLPPDLQPVPRCVAYSGAVTHVNLVAFINEYCGFHRTVDGELTLDGQRLHRMQARLFRPVLPAAARTHDDRMASLASPATRATTPCEVLTEPPDREVFIREYVSRSKPFVLRGGVAHWPALHKWTNEFLLETFADRTVHVKLGHNGDFEGCEPVSLWEADGADAAVPDHVRSQLMSPDQVVVRPARLNIPFSRFVDLLRLSDLQSPHSDARYHNVSFYIEYTEVSSYFPEMQHDIVHLPFADDLVLAHTNAWSCLAIGNGRTVGKLHFDPFDNILCMITGRKNVTIFPPHNNEELYEGHIREGQLSFDLESGQFSRRNLQDSLSMVMSPVDLLRFGFRSPIAAANVDVNSLGSEHFESEAEHRCRYPLFENAAARAMQCDIDAGDVLYMPSFWWHEVRSVPDDQARNIAINFWYRPFLDRHFPCAECRLFFNREDYEHMLPLLD